MRMKNKRAVFFVCVLVLFVWCVKGYWIDFRSDNLQAYQNSEAVILEKEKLLSTLRSEVALLRKKASKCLENFNNHSNLPIIYAITPTHTRPVQKAELTRLSHTLMLVPNLRWVIVEDSERKTDLVASILDKSGMPYTHLHAATPKTWKLKAKEPRWIKPRGVLQRNTALDWIRANVSPDTTSDGVIYFADDDNSYSLEVFEEMRYIKRVGVWPVGLVGGLMVERPKLDKNGKVTGWLTVWSPNRPFAVDMAGFAINLKLFLRRTDGKFAFEAEKGYQESELLKHFVSSLDDLEVKADNCTKVYVWHTRTEAPNLRQEDALRKAGKPRSDMGIEV